VLVYSYSSVSNIWWNQTGSRVERAKNLKVVNIPAEASQALAALAQRTMQLQCTIQDGQVWLGANEHGVDRAGDDQGFCLILHQVCARRGAGASAGGLIAPEAGAFCSSASARSADA
jgi:hypothetical protein